jgi:hypothetical protein
MACALLQSIFQLLQVAFALQKKQVKELQQLQHLGYNNFHSFKNIF